MRRLKKVLVILLICCTALVSGWTLIQKSLQSETEFAVPQNAKYVLVYSTGEGRKEKSEICYLDNEGNLITSNIINGVSAREAFSWNSNYRKYNFFTHDKIFFFDDESSSIENEEMKNIYKFASSNGDDEVYDSGFIDINHVYYKYIPHGLSYAEADLGFFDLITLYDDKSVRDIRIIEGAAVSVDQSTGLIYAIENETSRKLKYNVLKGDIEANQNSVETKELDLSKFYEENVKSESVVTIHKAVICNSKIYQVLSVGEETSKTYLAEIAISDNGKTLNYEGAYPLDIGADENITYDVPVIVADTEIQFYSMIKPNKIITFDTEDKKFNYYTFLEEQTNEDKWHRVRAIDNAIYDIEIDSGANSYIISRFNDDRKKEALIQGTLPTSKIRGDYWLGDFYIIGNDQ